MILTAISTEPGMAQQRFQALGNDFTIGRGADCDWTLPDPARQLSKRHCRMVASQGQWRLTDLSSNGMTLNERTVTPGVSHPVQHGDRLGMGSYDITLSIETAFDGPPLATDRADADASPFGDGRQGGRLIGDPFVSPASEMITDPFDVALPPLFEQHDERPTPAKGGSVGDNVSALQQPFEPPRPGHLLLPPDWDDPLPSPAPTPTPTPPAPVPSPPDADTGSDLPLFDPEPAFLPPQTVQAVEPPPVLADTKPPVLIADGGAAQDTASVPFRAAPAAASAAPAAGPDDAGARAFAAFARGAGLEGMPQDAPEEALEKLGRAFRAYVVGLRRLLIARATVKGEFRIDRTMIRPFGNNPIKFATDDNDAMAALLGIGRQVGMTAEQAVADSIRDVRSHELALNEAFQHAIREMVAEMSPEQVVAELQPGPFDVLPVLRNSRRWTLFESRHARLRASLDNSLDSVFGQAFARGYEAALARLSEADPSDPPSRTGQAP